MSARHEVRSGGRSTWWQGHVVAGSRGGRGTWRLEHRRSKALAVMRTGYEVCRGIRSTGYLKQGYQGPTAGALRRSWPRAGHVTHPHVTCLIGVKTL